MSTSLSSLLDSLSEINKKECKKCMERNNTKSECKFIKFENNRLNYTCKECNDKSRKSINKLKTFPIHIYFVMEILINFLYY